MMKRRYRTTLRAVIQGSVAALLCAGAITAIACRRETGDKTLHILTTNDVHGTWFSEPYIDGPAKRSLESVSWYVDSLRKAVGKQNVILLDAGDCLQGDNAPYYFNYVSKSNHLFPRIAKYMGYDAITVGNHDIETGHAVYDRVRRSLSRSGIPFLAGNAIDTKTSKPYFQEYTVLHRAGLRVLVLGYTNANIRAWLSEELWEGMNFEPLIPFVQDRVDAVKAKVKPDITIVSVHSGAGLGDGSMLESQGLDLFRGLSGVDFVLCSHDHKAFTAQADSICIINAGSHSRSIGHGVVQAKLRMGKVLNKSLSASLIPVSADRMDATMHKRFLGDFNAVRDFTMKEVGSIAMDLYTPDAFKGMSDYMNLLHTVQLGSTGAQVSFAAPLTYRGTVKAGTLVYNDMFTIYPFENQLYTMNLTGSQILSYLEYSYNSWIRTISSGSEHVLNIRQGEDPRTGQRNWSFVSRTYNFDSAAGICYTVDVTKPYGSRVTVSSMADGSPFCADSTYSVALTSYRANGGGDLLSAGAGIDAALLPQMVTGRCPEIRELVYRFISSCETVTPQMVADNSIIGKWSFVPEPLASEAIERDFALLFSE